MTKTKDQKAKERFENAWSSGKLAPEHHKFVEKEAVWSYISKEISKAREERTEEIIKLSDKIEIENDSVFDEWKAFKRFRNTLRDRYLKK